MKSAPRKSFWKSYAVAILFLGIFLLALFFRLYNIQNRLNVGDETIRDAMIGFIGGHELQFPLTGPFSSLGPFTFGPWYWGQYIIGTAIFRTIYSPWIVQILLSLGYIVVVFFLGKKIGGPVLGLLMAYFAAVSPTQILGSNHLTNPNMLHIYSALSVFFFSILITRKTSWGWGLAFGIVLTTAINIHFQAANLGVLVLLVLLWGKNRIPQLAGAALGFFIINIPLIFFNLLNHWIQVRNIVDYALFGKNAMYVANSWTIYITQFWPAYWSDAIGVPRPLGIALALIAIGAIFYVGVMKKNYLLTRVCTAFGLVFLILRFYGGQRYYGYHNFLSPFVFLIVSVPFWVSFTNKYKVVKIIGAIGFLIVSFFIFQRSWEGTKTQMEIPLYEGYVASIESAFPNKKIMLYNCKPDTQARDYSLWFFLTRDKRLGEGEGKIAFAHPSCSYPSADAGLYVESNEALQTIGAVNLSGFSEEEIKKAGWVALTNRHMYDTHVKWWYAEKP